MKGIIDGMDDVSDAEYSLLAYCPHCDREEEFDDEPTARAWLGGHIREKHPDELPAY